MNVILGCVCALSLSLVSGALQADAGNWYVGAGGGLSILDPDTRQADLEVDEDSGALAAVYVGRQFGRLALEGGYSHLGEAELSDGNSVSYAAVSLGGLYRLPLADSRRRRERGAVFARLGLNSMHNESDLELEEADSIALWAGVGAEWMLQPRLALRGEISSYDGDALGALVSLRWHPFAATRRPRQIVQADRSPESVPDTTSSATAPINEATPDLAITQPVEAVETIETATETVAPVERVAPVETVSPVETIEPVETVEPVETAEPVETLAAVQTTRVQSAAPDPSTLLIEQPARCSGGHPLEPQDSDGCPVLSGWVDDLHFDMNTATLAANSGGILDVLASRLRAHPDLVVELRTYTVPVRGEQAAMALTRERVILLARELAARGVELSRLRARAFGSTRPPGADGVDPSLPEDRVELAVLGRR